MGLLTDIFGGGDQTTTQAPFDPKMAKRLLSQFEGGIGEREYYGGPTVAGFTPEQERGFGLTTGAADVLGERAQRLAGAQDIFLDPSFMDPERNPYMQRYVESAIRPVTQQFTEQVMPGIRRRAGQTGAREYGSTRQGVAEGIAQRGYQDVVGDITSGMYSNLYGQNIDAMQRAMGMEPMVASMMGLPGQMYGGVGGQRQALEQAQIGEDVARYEYGRDIPYQDIETMLRLNAGLGGSTTQQGAGPLAGMLGAGMMAYGMPPITMMGSQGSPASTTMPRHP